jgi:hypothetical protein
MAKVSDHRMKIYSSATIGRLQAMVRRNGLWWKEGLSYSAIVHVAYNWELKGYWPQAKSLIFRSDLDRGYACISLEGLADAFDDLSE